MLKQLLKYEFKATKSLYFGLYLALALLSVVLGVSFRQENAWADNTNFGRLEVILMVLYLSLSSSPLRCSVLSARSSAFIKICWDVKAT